jgi:tRNA(fMet)-specific endonuclease VapC
VGILIDTGVFVEIERGRLDLTGRFAGRESEDFFVSVVTASELLQGVWRANDDVTRARRSAFAESMLKRFRMVDIDLAVARVHAQIRAHLAAAGTPIGPQDLWIAATCVTYGLGVLTTNAREFSRVPGLPVEVP